MLGIVQKRRQINNANDVHQSVYFFFSKLREIVSRGLGMTIEYIIGYSVLNLKSFILELSIFKVPF